MNPPAGGTEVSHALTKIAEELASAEEPQLSDEVRGVAQIVERMGDALARIEYMCLTADAENVTARRDPDAPPPRLTPQQVQMIREAVQG